MLQDDFQERLKEHDDSDIVFWLSASKYRLERLHQLKAPPVILDNERELIDARENELRRRGWPEEAVKAVKKTDGPYRYR